MKKIFAMLLCAVLLLSFAAVSAEDAHQLIYGATTEISGDFSASDAWFTNNATDAMIRRMTDDCTTVVMNKEGAYVVNPTVAASVEGVMNDDGTKTYTVQINDGLVFNNGEAITIEDFVWTSAFGCSPVASELGAKVTAYLQIAGGQEYYNGEAETISGLRILDDKTLAITIVSDYVPYYYDITYAAFTAFDMDFWLGDGVALKDDGNGVYFEGFTKEGSEAAFTAARFMASPERVSAGPYNLVEFDQASKQATLEANPNYAGNYEGQKPSIEKIVITKAEDATWADALKTGAFNFYDTMTDGTEINTAMDIIEDDENKEKLGYGFDYVTFDRTGT